MRYIRQIIPGGTYFFTVVTYQRQKIFISEMNITLLRQAFAYVINRHPFKIDAIAILPDHIHTIWTLPPEDSEYSLRWQLIKSTFTRSVNQKTRIPSNSRKRKGEQSVWQRRFWEHVIRDEDDFLHHVEYIHYNPVKHGFVDSPVDWAYSSFHEYVNEGIYPADWGVGKNIPLDYMIE